jgi:hypothetical protein
MGLLYNANSTIKESNNVFCVKLPRSVILRFADDAGGILKGGNDIIHAKPPHGIKEQLENPGSFFCSGATVEAMQPGMHFWPWSLFPAGSVARR